MLLEIQVHNVALIDALCLELGEGLNVLTGETGAGKSILVGALNLVLGGRADRSIIRTGEEQASVEALFDIGNCPEARELLAEWGIEGDGNLVSVKRSLTAAGRSLCRVAGSVLPLSRFRQLTGALVELHGQHEHQKLCDEGQHTGFLDAFGGLEHQASGKGRRGSRVLCRTPASGGAAERGPGRAGAAAGRPLLSDR